MNSYLLIEGMKLEVMSELKQTWPNNNTMWSNKPKYSIRVSVTSEQYDAIKKLKGKDNIPFTLKKKNGEFFIGHIFIESTLGLSKFNWGRIIDIHILDLKGVMASKDICRDLLLNELLD